MHLPFFTFYLLSRKTTLVIFSDCAKRIRGVTVSRNRATQIDIYFLTYSAKSKMIKSDLIKFRRSAFRLTGSHMQLIAKH